MKMVLVTPLPVWQPHMDGLSGEERMTRTAFTCALRTEQVKETPVISVKILDFDVPKMLNKKMLS
jgi:hypothetical protein